MRAASDSDFNVHSNSVHQNPWDEMLIRRDFQMLFAKLHAKHNSQSIYKVGPSFTIVKLVQVTPISLWFLMRFYIAIVVI